MKVINASEIMEKYDLSLEEFLDLLEELGFEGVPSVPRSGSFQIENLLRIKVNVSHVDDDENVDDEDNEEEEESNLDEDEEEEEE